MDRDSGNPASTGATGRPRRERRRRRRKASSLSAHAERLNRTLADAAKQALAELFGPREDIARSFQIELKVAIQPGHPWRVEAQVPLEEQIRKAVREMTAQAEVYRYGRIYCYRCESSDCSHSVPARPSCVFGGYSSTGIPEWSELSQVLLQIRHSNVDLLYNPLGREIAAVYLEAGFLKQRQLNVFGRQSKTYDILGQVVLGFLDLAPPGEERLPVRGTQTGVKPERVALTLQAVESRRLDGSARLDLNVLGRFGDGSPAMDGLTTSGPHHQRIFNIILEARQRIGSLVPRTAGGRSPCSLNSETVSRTEEILRRIARSLEQAGRQTCRRTAHVEERRVDRRPTSKALEDAAGAPDEDVLWDAHRNTVVVVGPKNRVHVFSREGRHVTSLVLDAEAVRIRLRRQRWQRFTGEGLTQFRSRVDSAAGANSGLGRTKGGKS